MPTVTLDDWKKYVIIALIEAEIDRLNHEPLDGEDMNSRLEKIKQLREIEEDMSVTRQLFILSVICLSDATVVAFIHKLFKFFNCHFELPQQMLYSKSN